jgi:D-sedoheptulose 7-phosphate isomerase
MHFAEELTGFYREKRMALPAIAISDSGHLTCVGNDIGFQYVFSRYIEALGKERDIFICLTTSGRSENITLAIEAARKKGLGTVAFLGKTGGNAKGKCDAEWIVEGFSHSDRIQEAHMAAIHIIIEMVEKKLFSEDILTPDSHAEAQASFN